MPISDFTSLLTRILFMVLALITLVDYVRHRAAPRLDIALLFGSFATTLLVPEVVDVLPEQWTWLSLLSTLSLAAHPYLLMRLVMRFRHVSHRMRRLALLGMLASLALIVIFSTELPTLVAEVIVIYIVFIDGYATTAFIQDARTSKGVVRQRLRFAALGSAFVTLVLITIGVSPALPNATEWLGSLTLLFTMLAAVAYYVGFSPPRWLNRAWQFSEFYEFLRQLAHNPSGREPTETLEQLRQSAAHAVGAIRALMVEFDAGTASVTVRDGTPQETHVSGTVAGAGLKMLSEIREPTVIRDRQRINELRSLVGGEAAVELMYAVPIATGDSFWGLLLTAKRGSLFPDDDIALLTLFAEQSAIALEYTWLLAEQRTLLAQLERHAEAMKDSYTQLESFSYTISHDLRAPLRAIDGFSRIVQEDFEEQFPPEARRYLDLIRKNAVQMGMLIDDLLAFSRVSRQQITKRPVALNSIVTSALDTVEAQRENRSIELVMGDLPTCDVDAAMLRQVFVNLLSNALKFTREVDNARVEVGCRRDDGEAVIFVKDNGVGFDMKYADKLFGVFQRMHRAEDYEGTGVGLAIVHRIVQRHGGRVWAESEIGKGTTFSFTLPCE